MQRVTRSALLAIVAMTLALIGVPAASAAPAPVNGDLPVPIVAIPNVQQSNGDLGLKPDSSPNASSALCAPETEPADKPSPTPPSDNTVEQVANTTPSAAATDDPADTDCLKLPVVKFSKYEKCKPLKFRIINPNGEMVPFQLWLRLQPTQFPLEVTALVGAFLPARFDGTGTLDVEGDLKITIDLWFGLWRGTPQQITYAEFPAELKNQVIDHSKCPKKAPPKVLNNDGTSASQTLAVTPASAPAEQAPQPTPSQAAPTADSPVWDPQTGEEPAAQAEPMNLAAGHKADTPFYKQPAFLVGALLLLAFMVFAFRLRRSRRLSSVSQYH